MGTFLAAALSFPTVIFTALLGLFFLYALATIFGITDFEAFDEVTDLDDYTFGIPLVIFIGVTSLFAWLLSFLAMRFLPDFTGVRFLVGAGAAMGGTAGAWVALRPLRKLFTTTTGPSRSAIVGKICTIRSLRVDGANGSAEVEDGGAGFIAEVRCFRENAMSRGDKAIIYDYDSKNGVYHVGPIDASIAGVDATLDVATQGLTKERPWTS